MGLRRDSKGRSLSPKNARLLAAAVAACIVLYISSSGRRRGAGSTAGATPAAVAAVNSSAAIHGFVRKEGPADLRNWHPDHKAWREARLQAWMSERERLLAEGQLPPPLPIYTGCQVYVNHLYKVVYLRHAKTASSSLFCHFGGCKGSNSSEIGGSGTSFDLLKVASEEELQRIWRDYFVVTFVRNPYQRAVSSYRMMMRQLAPGGEVARTYDWDNFCVDPTGFADQCMRDERCKAKGRNFVYIHIQPQHQCIVTASGGWAVDFIGRVEHIDEDLDMVLKELERRRPADAPPVKPLQGSLHNVNGRGCKEAEDAGHSVAREQYCDQIEYYGSKHPACFPEVQHHYYSDAHGLQYGLRP